MLPKCPTAPILPRHLSYLSQQLTGHTATFTTAHESFLAAGGWKAGSQPPDEVLPTEGEHRAAVGLSYELSPRDSSGLVL